MEQRRIDSRCAFGLVWTAWMLLPAVLAAEVPLLVPAPAGATIAPADFAMHQASPFGPREATWSNVPGEQLPSPPQPALIMASRSDPPRPPTSAYNATKNTMTWLPGGDDRFGFFSLESLATLEVGETWGIVSGMGFHFLNGPVQTDMPPRVFDFTIGVARRELIQPDLGYDFAFRVGAFSDFEGSARKGIRFPGHAVVFYRIDRTVELVLGVDYLDRDDISLLPVAGAVLTPTEHLRLEAVFPRPRLALQVMNTDRWIYLAGELGGGTWAIERVDLTSDSATYRDLRLVLGMEYRKDGEPSSSIEIGYIFDRKLSYRSSVGDYAPDDALMVRSVARY